MIRVVPSSYFLVVVAILTLSACKQDQVFSQAADMKQTSDQIETLATTMGSDPIKSCQRIAQYYSSAKVVTFSSLQGVPPTAGTCDQTAGQAAQLQKHLEIFALYADQLERAATNTPVDYKLGNLTTTLASAKIIGVGGQTDADSISKVGNAIAALITSQARYDLIRSTVLQQNANIQEMAKYAEAVSASDWCDPIVASAHNTQIGYCGIFEPEMSALSFSYCIIGKRIFGQGEQCGARPPVFPPTAQSAPAVTSDTAAASQVCDPSVIRVALRDGVHSPTEPAPVYSAPVIKDSELGRSSKSISASTFQAQRELVAGYVTAVNTVYDEVRAGWSYATAVCQFARAHQRLYDFINGSQSLSS